MSPLLFIIVIEAFNRMLTKAVGKNLLRGFIIDQFQVFYFLFAGDTLIFYDADVEQFKNLRRLFLCFESIFGLKINLGKPETITVGDADNVEVLADILPLISSQRFLLTLHPTERKHGQILEPRIESQPSYWNFN